MLKGVLTGLDIVTENDFKKTKCEMPLPSGYYETAKGLGMFPVVKQLLWTVYEAWRPE